MPPLAAHLRLRGLRRGARRRLGGSPPHLAARGTPHGRGRGRRLVRAGARGWRRWGRRCRRSRRRNRHGQGSQRERLRALPSSCGLFGGVGQQAAVADDCVLLLGELVFCLNGSRRRCVEGWLLTCAFQDHHFLGGFQNHGAARAFAAPRLGAPHPRGAAGLVPRGLRGGALRRGRRLGRRRGAGAGGATPRLGAAGPEGTL
mmetsp:Transcript_143310/g.458269  ORF Transcript_143310/g.458269 Transcript_143310/m.458269 type:complete len:202 (-) Transcript_143310:963-1568(-)